VIAKSSRLIFQRIINELSLKYISGSTSIKTQEKNHMGMEEDCQGMGFLRALACVDLALREAFVDVTDVLTSEPSVQLSIEVVHVVLS